MKQVTKAVISILQLPSLDSSEFLVNVHYLLNVWRNLLISESIGSMLRRATVTNGMPMHAPKLPPRHATTLSYCNKQKEIASATAIQQQ